MVNFPSTVFGTVDGGQAKYKELYAFAPRRVDTFILIEPSTMWSNISGVVGAAIQKVQKIQTEIEAQMDQAVGKDASGEPINVNSSETMTRPAQNIAKSSDSLEITSEDAIVEQVSALSAPTAEEGEMTTIDINEPSSSAETKAVEKEVKKPIFRKVSKSKLKASSSMSNVQDAAAASAAPPSTAVSTALTPSSTPSPTSVLIKPDESLLKEMENMKSQHAETLRQLEQTHKAELQTLRDKHAQDLQEKDKASSEKLSKAVNKKNKELEDEKAHYEERIRLLSSETQSEQGESVSLAIHQAEVGEYKQQLLKYEEEINQYQQQIAQLGSDNLKLNEDIARCKEVVSERERALESSNVKLSELITSQDQLTNKCADLANEIAEKDKLIKQLQLSSADESDMKKQLTKLLEQMGEKDKRLQAFESEGQSLAKKQSEMEKNIRKNRQEMKEKEQEIAKLKESKEQLVKAIEQIQDALRKAEGDSASHQKTLQAMTAVSQASTDKIQKMEQDIANKQEELISQKKALENAWQDQNELKKMILELKAERDDLKKQLGEGTSKVLETESNKRDIEQREAVLKATSKQLEETLKQTMQDSNMREERLRNELTTMQRKWQEAVMSREQLANELTLVTAPLLKQITSLQDQMRNKNDNFIHIEATLSEKLLKLENTLEVIEHKKALLEEENVFLKQQLSSVSAQLKESIEKVERAESLCDKFKKQERDWVDERKSLESKLTYESGQNKSIQMALKELEMKFKLDIQEREDKLNTLRSEQSIEISRLKNELHTVQEQWKQEKINNTSKHKKWGRSISEGEVGDVGQGNGVNNVPQQSLPSILPNGEISYAAVEKMQQKQRQREEEVSSLQLQLNKLEISRSALLEEVNFLSGKNAELEEIAQKAGEVQDELQAVQKEKDVLLILLGEKEEELEGLLTDMSEVKKMYQTHIQDLLEQIAPPIASPSREEKEMVGLQSSPQ